MTTEILDTVDFGGPLGLVEGNDPVAEHYTRRLYDSVTKVTRRLGAMAGPDTERELQVWRDRFYALGEERARQVVRHPYFSYYWLQLLDACKRGDSEFVRDWSRHLPRFVLVPHLENAPDPVTTVDLPAPRGQLRMPGHRFHLVLPAEVSRVEVGDDGDGAVRDATIRLPRGFLLGEGEPSLGEARRVERPVIAGTAIEVDSSDPWIARHLASMNTKPPVAGYPAPDLAPLAATSGQRADFDAAFRLIETAWPELVPELRAYVQVLVPYSSAFHSSFTEACLMGAVFLSEAKWPFFAHAYTAEHLLHEAGHLRLTLIEELDPLVSAAEDASFVSPVRRDPRPLSGMLQTVFAFARIAAFHRHAYAAIGDELYGRRRAESVELLSQALDAVESEHSVRFTPAGEKLWSQMRAEAAAG